MNGRPDIILDTTLTPDLLIEGERNEIVHAVNKLRKQNGFSVTDNVKLTLPKSNLYIDELIGTHKAYIMQEVKAVQLEVGDNLAVSMPDLGVSVSEEIQTEESLS
jgi:hypothetical protein